MDCEVLFPKISRRGTRMLQAMIDASERAGVRCIVTKKYKGKYPWLMSYGLGHAERRQWTNGHVENGGRLIGWDLGYWDREESMRLTIDHDHPYRLITDMPPTRLGNITLRSDADPNGPVLLIGMGRKSIKQFGEDGRLWDVRWLKKITKFYPDKEVIFRPKMRNQKPIEEVLRGVSLVVCRHSNVAIDACIAGVPVVCEDGAARALYNDDLSSPLNPSEEQRLQFLNNLAWWQWHPKEAVAAWAFIKGKLCA